MPILSDACRRGAVSVVCWPDDGSLFDRAARPVGLSEEKHECLVSDISRTETCSRLHASQYADAVGNEESVEVQERRSHS